MIGLHDTGGGGLAWFVCWRRGAGLRRQGVGGRHRAGRPAHRPLLVLLLQRAVRRVGRGRAPPAAAGYLQGRQQIASDIASDSDQLAGQLTPLGSLHMRGAHAAKANCGLSLGSITCMNMHPIPQYRLPSWPVAGNGFILPRQAGFLGERRQALPAQMQPCHHFAHRVLRPCSADLLLHRHEMQSYKFNEIPLSK